MAVTLIFDFNYQAFGVDPNESFDSAVDKELLGQLISPNNTPESKVDIWLI
jgi:hypothetical protein